jgi:hypothetical protein
MKVDTTPPPPPVIDGITEEETYYVGGAKFRIGGLESDKASVEYTMNYKLDNDGNDISVWMATTALQQIQQDMDTNDWYIEIPIPLNGNYAIAARQYDDANPRNRSEPSSAVIVYVRGE